MCSCYFLCYEKIAIQCYIEANKSLFAHITNVILQYILFVLYDFVMTVEEEKKYLKWKAFFCIFLSCHRSNVSAPFIIFISF